MALPSNPSQADRTRARTSQRGDRAVADGPPSPADTLLAAAIETERHVAAAGWDQPMRLFALVDTAELVRHEPGLAHTLGEVGTHHRGQAPTGYTAIEQEGLVPTSSIESVLAGMAWPPTVDGVALAVERVVVPPSAERDLPDDSHAALEALAAHPDRRDVRLLVAVLRDGRTATLLRQRAHDQDDRVAHGTDIAPGLVQAVAATLVD